MTGGSPAAAGKPDRTSDHAHHVSIVEANLLTNGIDASWTTHSGAARYVGGDLNGGAWRCSLLLEDLTADRSQDEEAG